MKPKLIPEQRTHVAPVRVPIEQRVVFNHRNPAPKQQTPSEVLAAMVREAIALSPNKAKIPPPRPRMMKPRRPPSIRSLLYHVYPKRGSWWRQRLYALRDRIELFNGRRIIAVAVDEHTDQAEEVFECLAGCRFTHITLENDRSLREGKTLIPLLQCVEDLQGSDHCTLWAHAKGVTRGDDADVQRWTRTLETLLLDNWQIVEEQLQQFACVGAFKKVGIGWSEIESLSDWHYSGSWFWFRNDQLFTQPDWPWKDEWWGCAESYPSCHWVSEDAGCIFHLREVPYMNLYKSDYWETHVLPDLERFTHTKRLIEVKHVREKLNVGCGPHYAEGWWNTDFVSNELVHPDQVVTPGRSFPWPDKTFTTAYGGHVIEHIWWDEVIPWLKELLRVVRPGGTVCIVGPDSKKVIYNALRSKDKTKAEQTIWDIIEDYVHHQKEVLGEERTGLAHLYNCYESRIKDVMESAGFKDVRTVEWEDGCLPEWPVVDYSNPAQFAVMGVVP